MLTRSGVGPSCVGLPAGDWPTITDFLVAHFPAISRATWLARMASGQVADEFGVAVTPERVYQGVADSAAGSKGVGRALTRACDRSKAVELT